MAARDTLRELRELRELEGTKASFFAEYATFFT